MKRPIALVWLAVATGAVLCLIGIRFLVMPDAAAGFFGIDGRRLGFALHHVIALRDLWLGALAVALALFREWRALALWLGLGSLVCFGDSLIAAGSSGRWPSVLFHAGSGVFCAGLAVAAWRARR